ncbi:MULTISPECIES: hypothetical protein [unclassified Clostridioides]|uniref:hypothetical protein n=1 Tax=unclassified Clostridioides TaxID=2635829 RepID=UPI001D126970|nr:hypothetical protein [Clostridioides sp. ES-S-0001-02]MCC0638965.1 hypothetical protein [Clostridioides sp. ES-S-0049-03]MCC0657308.1 hypothetical protein [Clostridioides sp. ES-S-0123-01]MCC0675355.1 hypothetical protein [Clostridioides sp. ES-W-0018-02]MCC0679971.1 hypothetical protein [Clostridioides sp. ES-S-0005-03]MCC0709836.1 hypothetical protein [Clostridioides sp. ES-W-0017-02]UDN46206.1 hypothetical protein JJJ25_11635 [Clostridioides sp. ES-S-0173-01]UDN60658.1 hypothetical pro
MNTESIQNNKNIFITKEYINNFEKIEEILEYILKTELEDNWGVISFETIKKDETDKIILPQINYCVKLREISKGKSYKPMLTDIIDELDENKEKTGKVIKVYRQSFDCILEFRFIAKTQKECRRLMEAFEDIITSYTGFLKKKGLGDIFFLKEISTEDNISFDENTSVKTSEYFIRLEKVKTLNVNKLKNIEMKFSVKDRI